MLDILNHLSSNESHMSFFLFGPPGQGPGPLGGGWRRPAGHGPGPRVGSMGQGAWARAHGPWPKPQLPSMLRIMFHKIRFGGGGEIPDFMKTKKCRSVITNRYQPVARLGPCCVRKKGNDNRQTLPLGRGEGDGGGDDGRIFPLSHRTQG